MRIIHVVSLRYTVVNGILSVLSDLIPSQERLGHDVYVLNIRKNDGTRFKNDIFVNNFSKFKSDIKNIKPDVVIFHGGYELFFYLFAAYLRYVKVPYFVEPHGGTSRYNLEKKKIVKTIINRLFTSKYITQATGVFFLNDNERCNSIFCKQINRYRIIPNGVKIPEIDCEEKIKGLTVRFIFLSRIDIKYKGLDVLLQAIEMLYKEHPEIKFEFHFYGGRSVPSIVEEFKNMISKILGPVYYHGEVLGLEKEQAFKDANIYVLPSLSEGMPITVLEALSYGNPCIVTPQTNMSEFVLTNHCGWVTEPNPCELMRVLYNAYNDYVLNRKYYIVNSITAIKQYDWNIIAKTSIDALLGLTQSVSN